MKLRRLMFFTIACRLPPTSVVPVGGFWIITRINWWRCELRQRLGTISPGPLPNSASPTASCCFSIR
ncbi:MAG TPA: hypothetical protein VM223_07975 [Planctomycetota bacterium]|nr:hypothetical protein [Planctomycetota bacterium]